MAVLPVVRYMILCDDCRVNDANPRLINLYGLLTNIDPGAESAHPLQYDQLCVYLALTECRGVGAAEIVCMFEETGERVFATPPQRISFGSDPLEVAGVTFRILACPFPRPGVYSVQFWYNDKVVDERPLRLR
ncbi:MAG: hypothetical protein HYS13_00525 [Planctomycetia bacterium]|nr:hypothetical protein [Planctomycetia bacterium]